MNPVPGLDPEPEPKFSKVGAGTGTGADTLLTYDEVARVSDTEIACTGIICQTT
jgi:hypothetical protein